MLGSCCACAKIGPAHTAMTRIAQHSTCRAGHEQETTQTLQDEERTIEGSARERHGLFRCGAFRAARIRRPSIQYSGVVFPPGPNSWPLNIASACSVPPTPLTGSALQRSVTCLPHTAG